MAHDTHFDDGVTISDTADNQSSLCDDLSQASELSSNGYRPSVGFTPKEIQMLVFSAAVQIYNSRPKENDYDAMMQAVRDGATLLAISGNSEVVCEIFEEITEVNRHPSNVYDRALSEIQQFLSKESR